jgi:HEPN domain-containing protein
MKNHEDLAKGWWRKGDSDLTSAQLCLAAGRAMDTACFHAQQAAEKYLKAYLVLMKKDFPFMHNLSALVELCKSEDVSFDKIQEPAEALTPYAVEARYDEDFWPDMITTQEAVHQAVTIRDFILAKLPAIFKQLEGQGPY